MVKSLGAVISAASFSAQDQKNLAALVQSQQGTESDDEELGAPAAAVYKTHSSSIFDVLKDMDEEKSLKASTEETKAVAEGDLADTVKGLAEDKKALATASSTCMTVAADHDATVKSRTEELTAIATAKKILTETSSGAVSQSYSLLQVSAK